VVEEFAIEGGLSEEPDVWGGGLDALLVLFGEELFVIGFDGLLRFEPR